MQIFFTCQIFVYFNQRISIIITQLKKMKALLRYGTINMFTLNGVRQFNFSEFKNKFEKFHITNYEKSSDLYRELSSFEKTLSYVEKLKYRKAIELLEKKIKKIIRKQAESSAQDNYKDPNPSLKSRQFNTQISYQIFYGLQNQKYKPIDEFLVLNRRQLPQLFLVFSGKNSSFLKDIDLINQKILSNPPINQTLHSKIQKRCQYLQQQLCLNVFEQYQQTTIQVQQSSNMQKNRGTALRDLKGSKKPKKDDTIFTKDFKFIIKKNLMPQQNFFASQIAKILAKYNFSTDKTKMFSVKSLSNQGYRSLTPASLKNHLYVLAYHKYQIPEFNDNLFKLFEIFTEQNQKFPSIQFVGKFDYMNSLLFYVLSNKIQNYELIKSIFIKIVESYVTYMKKNQVENSKQTIGKLFMSIDSVDLQLFSIMLGILQTKYELSPKSLKQEFKGIDLWFLNRQQIVKFLPKVNSNAHQDFQRYLTKKQYKYQKSSFESGSLNTLTSDIIYQIQEKKFICLHLSRINHGTKKTNGIGQLILQYFKFIGEQIKIINPLLVNSCQKWGQKQDYFKSKLKGLKQPASTKKRRYDI